MKNPLNPKPVLRPVYGADATGVAGWLGLLWLGLVFVTPGLAVFAATKLYNRPRLASLSPDVFRSLEIVEWSVVAATTSLCWFLAWRLSNRPVWRSVQIVIAGLWVNAVVITLAEFVGISLASGLPLFFLIENGWRSLVWPIAIAALWTVYLLRSSRVARTYKRHAPLHEITDAFD